MKNDPKIWPARFGKTNWEMLQQPGPNVKISRLRLVTFNIWFGEHFFSKRLIALIDILRKTNADIIALQEVNEKSLMALLKTDWIREKFYVSDISSSTFYTYGVVILSRLPIKNLKVYPLTSMMSRNVLIAEYVINGSKLLVASTHLESLKHSENIRAVQLNEIFSLLGDSDNAILMGDLNFCSSWDENSRIDKTYQDVWSVLRPNEFGYTEDEEINTMRKALNREEKKVRFDRILLKSKQSEWEPASIKRLGTDPISTKTPDVFPSDHFGLLAQLNWSKNYNEQQ